MKKSIIIFLSESFLCGLFTFIGSVLGHAFGQTSLFLGAMTGGFVGVILTTLMLCKTAFIKKDSFLIVILFGITSFLLASIFAVTNLNSPIIPLLGTLFVGVGCILGNSYATKKEQRKSNVHAIIGFLFILPALYFVVGSIVKYNFGVSKSFTLLDWFQSDPIRNHYFNEVSPFVFIGGILFCLLLNISFLNKPKHEMSLFSSLTLKNIQKINLLMIITSSLLLFALSLYVIVENF